MGTLKTFIFFGLLFAVSAFAGDEPVVLPEVTSSAPKEEKETLPSSVSQRDMTGAASTVSRQPHAGEVKDASEFLATTPGVVVQDRGGAGQSKTVSIRGASPNGVMVLLDGLPLSQSSTNVDLSRLPSAIVDRFEILRGGAGARYGSGGLGGVVNVITRPAGKDSAWFGELTGGSFESFSGNAGVSAPLGGGEGLFLLYGGRSRGNFQFLFDEAPQFEGNAPRLLRRDNNDSLQAGFLSKYKKPFGNLNVSAMAEGLWDDRGLAGTVQNPTSDARQATRRLMGTARVEKKTEGREWSAQAWGRGEGLRLEGGLFGSPFWQTDSGAGLEWNGQTLWGSSHAVAGMFSAAFESVRSTEVGALAPSWVRLGAMASDEWWLADSLALVGSLRADNAGTFFELSPKLGLLWQLPKDFEVRLNGGRAHRIPSFLELYVRQGQLLPNPDLRPESAWFADAQVARKTKTFSFSVGGFHSHYADLISYEFYPPLLARPFNFSAARVSGLEVEGQWRRDVWLEVVGSYTFLVSENLTEDVRYRGRALPYRPQHKAHAQVRLGPSWLSGRGEVFYQSQQFVNRTESLSLPGRAFVNVGLHSRFLTQPSMSLSLEVKNVFDVYAQDLDGYPLPSRGAYLTWSWESKK